MFISPDVITAVVNVVLSKYATPVWGVVSGYLMYQLKSRTTKRDDFTVIKDSLFAEIDRLKSEASENKKTLEASLLAAREESEKAEAKYFELTTQHRELLKHCVFLTKELKVVRESQIAQQKIMDKNANTNQAGNNSTTS